MCGESEGHEGEHLIYTVMLKKISVVVIILLLVSLNGLRFWKLDTIPNGFHVDEAGSAVTMQCFSEKGCDAELTPWPLFGYIEYGQHKPPTYIYPGILWTKLFGSTVPSLRGYSAFALVVGILGLYFLASQLFGRSCGLIVVLAASCSPWAWVVTRVALESYFAPVFVIWGLYCFWRSTRWWNWILAGFLFACAMYTYPPARLQVPLMLLTIVWYEWGRRRVPALAIVSFLSSLTLSLFPLVNNYLRGDLSRRFNKISIFNQNFLHSAGATGKPFEIIGIFFHNYFLHLTPRFLFLSGDPSYVHSTRHLGIFSLLDILALAICTVLLSLFFLSTSWKESPIIKNGRLILFLAVNFFIGIIPSALTNQELPHALRMCGSWPFMMLFTGIVLWSAAELAATAWIAIALAGMLAGGILTYQYFMIYPKESKGMFDYWVKEQAENLKTGDDWKKFILIYHRRNYHIRYFMVHRLKWTCKEANDFWWQIHDSLAKRGLF